MTIDKVASSGMNRRDFAAVAAASVAAILLPRSLAATSLAEFNQQHNTIEMKERDMATITLKDGTQIYYKDWGPKNAQPVAFHYGWPLSSDDSHAQMLFFLANGYRVVAHDRRGHGGAQCPAPQEGTYAL